MSALLVSSSRPKIMLWEYCWLGFVDEVGFETFWVSNRHVSLDRQRDILEDYNDIYMPSNFQEILWECALCRALCPVRAFGCQLLQRLQRLQLPVTSSKPWWLSTMNMIAARIHVEVSPDRVSSFFSWYFSKWNVCFTLESIIIFLIQKLSVLFPFVI